MIKDMKKKHHYHLVPQTTFQIRRNTLYHLIYIAIIFDVFPPRVIYTQSQYSLEYYKIFAGYLKLWNERKELNKMYMLVLGVEGKAMSRRRFQSTKSYIDHIATMRIISTGKVYLMEYWNRNIETQCMTTRN